MKFEVPTEIKTVEEVKAKKIKLTEETQVKRIVEKDDKISFYFKEDKSPTPEILTETKDKEAVKPEEIKLKEDSPVKVIAKFQWKSK